jgi:hypothetical protein
MKVTLIAVITIASMCLCACSKPAVSQGANRHGRYVGIGIYRPGSPWTKMVATATASDSPAAKPIDDQAIIVVTDSDTGEIRACGDLTGYCIGMNPWNKALVPAQTAPINLSEHEKPARSEPGPTAPVR